MNAKTETAETATPKLKRRQVSATIEGDVASDLEGYAFGTRRKLTQVVAEALVEYHQNHKAEIDAKKVD